MERSGARAEETEEPGVTPSRTLTREAAPKAGGAVCSGATRRERGAGVE